MNRKYFMSFLATAMIVLGSVAIAQGQNNQPSYNATSSIALVDHVKTGHFTLAEPAMVGNTILGPGVYQARRVDVETGHYVQFARRSDQPSDGGETGQGFYTWEVVANIPCWLEARGARAGQTALEFPVDSAVQASILTIRGESVAYLF
jgi:hypothetical protein